MKILHSCLPLVDHIQVTQQRENITQLTLVLIHTPGLLPPRETLHHPPGLMVSPPPSWSPPLPPLRARAGDSSMGITHRGTTLT